MTILIVEDEDILSSVLQEKFEEKNFKVILAKDGSVVLPLVKKNRPDAILLDILLPKVNGMEVLSQLKADEDLRNIPVIVMSNLGEDSKIKEALQLGAVDYMVKTQHPINELIEKVKEYILKAK
ncbi:MAG: response regulator [Candidatus Paceibacterota bacterium]|jgi:DNA-binding response OmpR family regulator